MKNAFMSHYATKRCSRCKKIVYERHLRDPTYLHICKAPCKCGKHRKKHCFRQCFRCGIIQPHDEGSRAHTKICNSRIAKEDRIAARILPDDESPD